MVGDFGAGDPSRGQMEDDFIQVLILTYTPTKVTARRQKESSGLCINIAILASWMYTKPK